MCRRARENRGSCSKGNRGRRRTAENNRAQLEGTADKKIVERAVGGAAGKETGIIVGRSGMHERSEKAPQTRNPSIARIGAVAIEGIQRRRIGGAAGNIQRSEDRVVTGKESSNGVYARGQEAGTARIPPAQRE